MIVLNKKYLKNLLNLRSTTSLWNELPNEFKVEKFEELNFQNGKNIGKVTQ